ncbi:MAG: GFA family protein [Alphaproteobacteria bacterium]|nr:GFA family protein [Alphaproteobacteria bacterium]
MKVNGRCHCGAVTYTAEVNPQYVMLCHCTDCQVMSGSAHRTIAPARAETFKLLSGDPKSYMKTADSGAKRGNYFCPDCGTPLYSMPVEDQPKYYGLRVGALDQRNDLVPQKQIWMRSAQHWAGDLSSLDRVDGQP